MSEDDNTQPVVQTTETPALPGAEVTVDARNDGDDLDKLLSEFEQHEKPKPDASSTTKPEPSSTTAVDPQLQTLVAEQVERGLQSERRKAEISAQYDNLLKHICDETSMSKRVVKGWVEELAKEKPELASLYFGAKTDAERTKVMTSLTKEFRKELSKNDVDERATEDRALVAAAVRGASTRAPEGKAPNFAAMSDQEIQAEKDKLFGT